MTNLNDLNIEYVRKVNQLRPKNKEDFEYVAARITNNVTLSEDETDEIILEILEDLLIAQSNGTTANEFFGHDLDQFVSEITTELPKKTIQSILLYGTFTFTMLFSIIFVIIGFSDFLLWISDGKHIDIPIKAALLITIVFLIFSLLSIFVDSNSKNRSKTQNVIQSLFGFLSYSVSYIIFKFVTHGPTFNIPFYISIIIAAFLIYLSVHIKRTYFPKKRFI
ncbi:DUF1129 family protein [Macrococcus capreoli]